VLRLVRVLDHLVKALCRARAEHNEAHRVARGLAGNSRVLEERLAEDVVDLCARDGRSCVSQGDLTPVEKKEMGRTFAPTRHAGDTEPKRRAMLDDLVLCRLHLSNEPVALLATPASIDEPDSKQRSALAELLALLARAGPCGRGREVRPEKGPAARERALVDDAEGRGRREFGPIVGPRQEVEVLSEEGIRRRARRHEGVRERKGRVIHGRPRLERVLCEREQSMRTISADG
jgi:hypothetical protein